MSIIKNFQKKEGILLVNWQNDYVIGMDKAREICSFV
jgi:hypothetical protein